MTFEVAATFVPIAGQAGEASKVAKGVEVVEEAVNVTAKTAEALRAEEAARKTITAGEVVVDGSRLVRNEAIELGGRSYARYLGKGPLFRGDSRAPAEIFREGFRPKGAAEDLADFVATNRPSVFVSTSTSVDVARSPSFAGKGSFVYDIDSSALRGIDVNKSLGKHVFDTELEIAIPGGIPKESIRSARQVMSDGTLGPKVRNPNYVGPE